VKGTLMEVLVDWGPTNFRTSMEQRAPRQFLLGDREGGHQAQEVNGILLRMLVG